MRKFFLLGCIGVCLIVGILAIWLTAPKHHISMPSLYAIERGMTKKEVVEILGVPPGNYSTCGGWAVYFGYGKDECPVGEEWVGDEIAIRVVFDDKGIVVGRFMGEVHRNEGFVFHFLSWLGLVKPPFRICL